MLDLHIIANGAPMPVFDLPAFLGRNGAAKEIGNQIEALIAFMDDLGGDPDLENDSSDHEPDDDAKGDISWPEWHTRGQHKEGAFGGELMGRDRCTNMLREDDEDDDPDTSVEDRPEGFDPEEDCCLAGDDTVLSGAATTIGGAGFKTYVGSDDDDERRDQRAATPDAAAND